MLIVSFGTFGVSLFIYCGVSRLFCFQDEPPLENSDNTDIRNSDRRGRASNFSIRKRRHRSQSSNNNNSNRNLSVGNANRIPATPKKR